MQTGIESGNYMLLNTLKIIILCWITLFTSSTLLAKEKNTGQWPIKIKTEKGEVIIYQPQPETLKGDQLKARAAISIELKSAKTPIFGAVWFDARLQIDRTERTATIANIKLTNIRIPEAGNKNLDKLKLLLEQEIPKWTLQISMDQLLATLKLEQQRSQSAEKINTSPPDIIFMPEPAILVTIDGEPELRDVTGRSLKRVINTPYTIIYDPDAKLYYLNADKKTWYVTSDLNANWEITKDAYLAIAELAPKENLKNETDKSQQKEDKSEPGPPPVVVVRYKPAELISATGKPEFKPVKGSNDLLYMSNTDSDVLMDINKQKYYVLLAGRWYISDKMQGPWKYVAGENLPAYFAKIPEDSQMGTVLYAVPGTDIAKAAVLDAQIPQTAAITRNAASLNVKYDGAAVFKPILSTSLSYAVNTATPVIKIASNLFYAVDEAVWFTATTANGPWNIATSVPDVIYTIPADSPLYNVTFVKIYKVEPEIIYVGYTPGYTYTYIYGSTIVYGTGYYYPGWYHTMYYPNPATWGYHVRWNPYGGWGYGVSYSNGPFTFSIGYGGWYHGGWWGPHHYYGYGHGYRHGYRYGTHAGYRAGYYAARHRPQTQNIYKSQRNQVRAKPVNQPGNLNKARPASGRANNVYADRQGNVHRKTDQGWQNRSSNGWNTTPGNSQKNYPGNNQGSRNNIKQTPQLNNQYRSNYQSGSYNQQLQQSHRSRQSGAQRSQNFNRARSGAVHGGGGRRR
jgi:hypothetical protein